ncbi:MAG: O-methyltransferase [Bacillota bacterium]|jgi:predicted O-methyltransferase YrrM|nr:O-methyltransferase [Bacillota bacterium]
MKFVNDKVTEYIDSYYRPLNENLMKLRESAEEAFVPIITRDTEMLLLNLLRIRKPMRILEIGTAVGYSAICFASLLPNTKIISLEVREDMVHTANENVKRFQMEDRIEIRLGDAAESLTVLNETLDDVETQGFDMVFIDAAKSHYKIFWNGSLPLCRRDAVIVSDNILLKARTASDEFVTKRRQMTSVRQMRDYIKTISESALADTTLIPIGDGVALSVLRNG